MKKKANILMVDDHTIIRDALKLYFKKKPEYIISGEAADGKEALEILKEQSFDIVITDLNMPGMGGVELCKEIKNKHKDQKILVFSMLNDGSSVKQVLEAGVNGYLLKTASKEEIFEALDALMDGQNYIPEPVTQIIIDSLRKKKKPTQRLTLETPLTTREKEVLSLIVKEYTNQEIADALFISIRTVDAHKRNLLDKTGCKNIAGLVIYAVEHGIM